MSKLKIFLLLSGYQLTYLMCIFGEVKYQSFLPGLVCGLIFLFLSFITSENKKKFIFIIFSISMFVYLFDSILVFFKVYNFNVSMYFGILPVWMLILWPSFATLFVDVFNFLSKYKLIAILLSGILGPLAYYVGSPLGLLHINQIYLFFFLTAIFWSSIMFFYLTYLMKLKFR